MKVCSNKNLVALDRQGITTLRRNGEKQVCVLVVSTVDLHCTVHSTGKKML